MSRYTVVTHEGNRMKTVKGNPDTIKTIRKKYPLYRKFSHSADADIKFIGNLSVAMIDQIVKMDGFKAYEKASQERRQRYLQSGKAPLEFEEVIRLKQPGREQFKINFDTTGLKMPNEKLIQEWENKVVCMDCVQGMKQLPDNSVDMCVFSPPYDMLRTYNGSPEFDLHATGLEVYRILKEGGICAMVIQDQTKNFAKSLTTFRTIVDWVDNIKFRMFECVIYHKHGTEGAWWKKRFRVDHEYIPLFLKGERPAYFNKEGLKVPSKHGGKVLSGFASRKTDGTTQKSVTKMINPMKCRGTVWDYLNAGDKNPTKRKHPAPFPDKMPYDLIQCFTQEGDLVIDPYMGSGSTAVAAKKLGRRFMGFDISEKYIEEIANKRIAEAELEVPVDLRESDAACSARMIFQNAADILDSKLPEADAAELMNELMNCSLEVQRKFTNLLKNLPTNENENDDPTGDCGEPTVA